MTKDGEFLKFLNDKGWLFLIILLENDRAAAMTLRLMESWNRDR